MSLLPFYWHFFYAAQHFSPPFLFPRKDPHTSVTIIKRKNFYERNMEENLVVMKNIVCHACNSISLETVWRMLENWAGFWAGKMGLNTHISFSYRLYSSFLEWPTGSEVLSSKQLSKFSSSTTVDFISFFLIVHYCHNSQYHSNTSTESKQNLKQKLSRFKKNI